MVNAIGKIVREIFDCNATEIIKFENVANNSVYSFKCNDEPYIFKFFRNEYWPEDGKLQFVNQLLLENKIPCAKLITFTRDNPEFPNGYLIEQELNGITADKLQLAQLDEVEFYKNLLFLYQIYTEYLSRDSDISATEKAIVKVCIPFSMMSLTIGRRH